MVNKDIKIQLKIMQLKIKKILFSIVLISQFSCRDSATTFDRFNFECVLDANLPRYDLDIVSIINSETGEKIKDTAINKIAKTRNIFKPCLKYLYIAYYKDSIGKLLSNDKIVITSSGKRWEYEKHKQDEIIIRYEYTNETENRISKHQISYPDFGSWIAENTTGVIENVEEVWMHPFRGNQYIFTEVAPFPHVEFPLDVGKTWYSNLSIHSGWGSWSDTNGNISYEITGKNRKKFPFHDKEIVYYVIDSKANFPFGISKAKFWFSEKFGFLKMEYSMYNGEYLSILLNDVYL